MRRSRSSSHRSFARNLAAIVFTGYASAQPRTGPAGPPVATETRNYEAKGDFDFLNTCAVCHGRIEQAAPLTILQNLSPEKIYETITNGSMKSQAANLTNEQRVKIAELVVVSTLESAESCDLSRTSN